MDPIDFERVLLASLRYYLPKMVRPKKVRKWWSSCMFYCDRLAVLSSQDGKAKEGTKVVEFVHVLLRSIGLIRLGGMAALALKSMERQQ